MASVGADSSPLVTRLLEKFKKAYGIDVELRLVTWGRSWSMLMKAMKERDLPDVFQVGSTWVATLAHLNILCEVPIGIWTRPAVASWIEATARVDGVTWAVPWTAECNVLVAREDLLASTGLTPERLADWPGFLEACRLFSRPDGLRGAATGGPGGPGGVLPIAVHCRPDTTTLHWATPWLWAGGWQIRLGDLEASPSAALLGDESAAPGLEFWSELCRSSPALKVMANASAGRVVNDFFVEGRYAFYTGHSVHVLRRYGSQGEQAPGSRWPLLVLPLPRGPSGSVSRGGSSLLAVARTSRQKTAAWELVRHLTSDPALSEWSERSGEMPAVDCEYWRQDDRAGVRKRLFEILSRAKTYPAHRLWRTIESILMAGFSEICWHFLEGNPYEERAKAIARGIDERIRSVLQLGWGATA